MHTLCRRQSNVRTSPIYAVKSVVAFSLAHFYVTGAVLRTLYVFLVGSQMARLLDGFFSFSLYYHPLASRHDVRNTNKTKG